MSFVYKKSFLGGKFVEDYSKKEFDLKDSKLKVKGVGEGFVLSSRVGGKTPVSTSFEIHGKRAVECTTVDNERCMADFETGAVSEVYLSRINDFVVTKDKKVKILNESLKSVDTGLEAVLEKSGHNGTPDFATLHSHELGFFVIGKNEQGKYGAIDASGKTICPFVFDSPEISLNKEFFEYGKTHGCLSFVCKGKEVIVDEKGKFITEQPFIGPYDSIKSKKGAEYFSVYDKKNNRSSIIQFNFETRRLEPVTTLEGKARYFDAQDKDGSDLFATIRNGKVGVVRADDSVVLEHGYDSVSTINNRQMDETLFEVSVDTGKKGSWNRPIIHKGIYSLSQNKILVQPEYEEFDYGESGRAYDGLLKFCAEKDGYWGAVNEKGETEVPHVYNKDNLITYRYGTDNDGYSSASISERVMKHKDGGTFYFNIKQPNIIATRDEVKDIEKYEQGLKRSSQEDKRKKEAKKAADAAKRSAESKRRDYDDDTTRMAIGASILAGSPVAGLIVKAYRDENGPSNE